MHPIIAVKMAMIFVPTWWNGDQTGIPCLLLPVPGLYMPPVEAGGKDGRYAAGNCLSDCDRRLTTVFDV